MFFLEMSNVGPQKCNVMLNWLNASNISCSVLERVLSHNKSYTAFVVRSCHPSTENLCWLCNITPHIKQVFDSCISQSFSIKWTALISVILHSVGRSFPAPPQPLPEAEECQSVEDILHCPSASCSTLNDYRTVALSSHVMKMFERLVRQQQRTLVSNFLGPLQFAYKIHIGVEDAIIFLML